MESSEISSWLPDVNVWLALCSDRHEHHDAAAAWLDAVRAPLYFCRVTQMALLRLLSNPKVMGSDVLTPQEAIGIYQELRADERIRYAHESADIERLWLSLMAVPSATGVLDRRMAGCLHVGSRLKAGLVRRRHAPMGDAESGSPWAITCWVSRLICPGG
jgi:toxin-antitoxin system PIN domain toxin